MNRFLVKDSTGKKSLTCTVFLFGSLICTLKLLISGLEIGGLKMAEFSGGEFAAAIGALGGIYVLRRSPLKDE